MEPSETQISASIAELDPRVELIAVERPRPDALRLYIDHPEGVGLELCERITLQVRDLLADYALEVSSPGLDRPLTKPEHYRQFLGQVAKIRTCSPVAGSRNFTGSLIAADAEAISIESAGGTIEIPFDLVSRANLVPELSEVQS